MTIKSKPALSIKRTSKKVVSTIHGERIEKNKSGTKLVPGVIKNKNVMVSREVLAELVREAIENKRKKEGKQKQYKSQSSVIMRVPNEIKATVTAMIIAARKKRKDNPDVYR